MCPDSFHSSTIYGGCWYKLSPIILMNERLILWYKILGCNAANSAVPLLRLRGWSVILHDIGTPSEKYQPFSWVLSRDVDVPGDNIQWFFNEFHYLLSKNWFYFINESFLNSLYWKLYDVCLFNKLQKYIKDIHSTILLAINKHKKFLFNKCIWT